MQETAASAVTPPRPPPVARRAARAHRSAGRPPGGGRLPVRFEKDRSRRGLWVLALLALSAAAHLGLFEGAVRWGLTERSRPKPPQKIEVAVIEKKAEPPPPPPPPPPEPPKAKAAPPPKPVAAPPPPPPPAAEAPPPPPVEAPPPPVDAPPPPVDAPPPTPSAAPPAATAVPIVGISLSSTASGGAFAMNVGNTAYGQVARVAATPTDVKPYVPPPPKPYKAEKFVAAYQLPKNEAPQFLGNVSDAEMERFYPPTARRDEVEDEVVVKLLIDGDGSVASVTVVKWIHREYPFDEAAKKLAALYRFKPATVGGQPVATEVNFTIRWELPY